MDYNNIYKSYMYSYPHKTAYRELNNINFTDYVPQIRSEGSGLYFHIPFCSSKCGYCNLFSITGTNREYHLKYITAMEEQMASILCKTGEVNWNSITIGGGTPLLLDEYLLERLLQLAYKTVGNGKNIHSCIETSPCETTIEKLNLLKKFDIKRVSIGVQSFNDEELKKLGRQHNSQQVRRALILLQDYNFDCLNIDLIYGIDGQTQADLKNSVDNVLKYNPDEIFIYPLYIRTGTILHRINSTVLSAVETYEQYIFLKDYLKSKGFYQTSMRRFCRKVPDINESCGFENTLSVGCGGRSYLGNLHFCTPYASSRKKCVEIIDEYIINPFKDEIKHGILLDIEEQKRRFSIKNLLYYCGVSQKDYRDMFKNDFIIDFSFVSQLIEAGYIALDNGFFKLTPQGMGFSDYIGTLFISPEIAKLMEEWS